MPLASPDDVAARLGRQLSADELPRVAAYVEDVTGLVEDYCGRDLARRSGQTFTLYSEGGSLLRLPARITTALAVSAVVDQGGLVTDFVYTGRVLVRTAGWGPGPVAVTGSWGYEIPPATLRAVVCSEVVRWLALSPGVVEERVGEVEVRFADSSSQSLSPASRTSLRPYRRRGIGSLTLRRTAPFST